MTSFRVAQPWVPMLRWTRCDIKRLRTPSLDTSPSTNPHSLRHHSELSTRSTFLKIVVVIDSLAMGGAERVVSLLTREWVAQHHEVIIALFDASDPAFDYGGRIVDLRLLTNRNNWKRLYRLAAGSIRLARLFRHEHPDRIVAFMESANFPCIVAAKLTDLLHRLCVSVHIDPAALPTPYRLLIPWLYRVPSRVIGVSQGVTRALAEMGVPAARLSSIPNPMEMPRHTSLEKGSPYPTRYILGVGRLTEQKGFDRLLTAFSEIPLLDLHLVILGEGDRRQQLIFLAQKLAISSRVYLPGVVSNVDAWYRHAECFVLSSNYEGWGNVVMEAMAAECPVVSFDCPYGPAEILENGKCGLLVERNNVAELTEAIVHLVSNPDLRARFIEAANRRVMDFAVETLAPLWLESDGDHDRTGMS